MAEAQLSTEALLLMDQKETAFIGQERGALHSPGSGQTSVPQCPLPAPFPAQPGWGPTGAVTLTNGLLLLCPVLFLNRKQRFQKSWGFVFGGFLFGVCTTGFSAVCASS